MTVEQPLWEDHAWSTLPVLEDEIDADVCVVGLGGSGLAAVSAARSAGAEVVGLDRGAVASGAAGRNAGFLLAGGAPFHHRAVESWGRDRARRVYQHSLDELDRIASEAPSWVRRTGSLRIAYSAAEEQDCAEHLAALRADGFPAKRYEGPEGTGLLVPTDAAVQPVRRAREIARRALAGGARLYERSEVHRIVRGHVTTSGGGVRCSTVVVAVDGGLERVLPELRGRVRTARAQMLASGTTREVHLTRPVYARYGYDYWQQLPDGRIVLGGCRDRFEADEWVDDPRPTPPVQAELDRLLRRIGVAAPVTHRWAGSIAFTRSGLPVLDEVRPGVIAVGAYSGTGNVLGSLYGRVAALLAVGQEPPQAAGLTGG